MFFMYFNKLLHILLFAMGAKCTTCSTTLCGRSRADRIETQVGFKDKGLHVVTWNVAAVNRNPFEYWITHPSEEYATMMQKVEHFMDASESEDVAVSDVFTFQMMEELEEILNKEGYEHVEKASEWWKENMVTRRIISGFIKDKIIGEKRLISMPDRLVNTISGPDEKVHYRPTIINGYEKPLDSMNDWWRLWKQFMFVDAVEIEGENGVSAKRPCELLSKISSEKYPRLSKEESEMSLPLQIMCLAVFDAIMVNMMNFVAPKKWHPLKMELMEIFTGKKKTQRTVEILLAYIQKVSPDAICLQEVAANSIIHFQELNSSGYITYTPGNISYKRDQNSVIILNNLYDNIQERTSDVLSHVEPKSVAKGIQDGDLFVIEATKRGGDIRFVFASFHGDTMGLLTLPVVKAVHKWMQQNAPSSRLVFGLDANSCHTHVEGKKQGLDEFIAAIEDLGLESCFQRNACTTTFNARTFLQPQLNKAVRLKDVRDSSAADRNPRDHVLVDRKHYAIMQAFRDNHGVPFEAYDENAIFPTRTFPSDHSVVYAIYSHA
eukprot:GEMP01012323.1.p1 GENE.GEMP01012323.1~~GEMP01012323.1.p1  ORF type:complete len:549 (+),score=90.87 GEMP01012323.1:24-1670(+)